MRKRERELGKEATDVMQLECMIDRARHEPSAREQGKRGKEELGKRK